MQSSEADSVSGDLEHLDEYKATVTRLFPALPKDIVEGWSIKDVDARALALFLDRFPRETVVLEVGTLFGVSTFHLASQPKVSEVVSVDWNPSMAELDEWGAELDKWGADLGSRLSPDLRVLDVAEATLARFSEQRRKVQLVAGTVGSVRIPVSVDGISLVAFVDGSHSKEAVEADLRCIFGKNPHAVAVLHDCAVGSHPPSVLAGIAAFVEASRTGHHLDYRFRLFERLDPDLTPPNLGVLYPEEMAVQVERDTAGLLADPASSLFRATQASWQAWLQLSDKAERQQKRANRLKAKLDRQRKQADTPKAKPRTWRLWWQRFFR